MCTEAFRRQSLRKGSVGWNQLGPLPGRQQGAMFENKQVCLDKVTGRGPGVAGRTHSRAARLEYNGPYWRCASRRETGLLCAAGARERPCGHPGRGMALARHG